MKIAEEKYVESKGLHCPHCGSDNIDSPMSGAKLNEDATIDLPCNCDSCYEEWTEIYSLTGVDDHAGK